MNIGSGIYNYILFRLVISGLEYCYKRYILIHRPHTVYKQLNTCLAQMYQCIWACQSAGKLEQ